MNILWLYNIPVLFYLFCWSDGSNYDQCELFQSTVWPFVVSLTLECLICLFVYFQMPHLLVLQNTPGSFNLFSVLALEKAIYLGVCLFRNGIRNQDPGPWCSLEFWVPLLPGSLGWQERTYMWICETVYAYTYKCIHMWPFLFILG